VQRIFELFDQGVGYRAIANILEQEGHPSPGEVGPVRHPRSAGVWGGSVVRSILTNPRYLGHQVVGRQRRRDELVEPTNPAAGTISRQHWQSREEWVTSGESSWPALVDHDLWERVNARITDTRGPSRRRRPRSAPGQYLLAGILRCASCGRSMHGSMLKNKPYYRCDALRSDYAETGHPRSTAVREERIVAVVDEWLNTITDPEHRDRTIAAVLEGDKRQEAEPADVRGARRALTTLSVELDRVLAAVRAGMDPDLAVSTTKRIQQELASAQAIVDEWDRGHQRERLLTTDEISLALDHAGSLTQLLAESEREPRARLYRTLGLELQLDVVADPKTIDVRLQLCGGGGRI
jgi:site-specific DNA recombinase